MSREHQVMLLNSPHESFTRFREPAAIPVSPWKAPMPAWFVPVLVFIVSVQVTVLTVITATIAGAS